MLSVREPIPTATTMTEHMTAQVSEQVPAQVLDTTARRRTTGLLLVTAVAAAVALPLCLTEAPQDDSYISYLYARNLVRGEGLVWNPGESPVEGYTNFLWTLLVAGGMKLGLNPESFAPTLGLISSIGVVLLTARLAMSLGASALLSAGAALLMAVRPTLTEHSVSGLEMPLFTLLLLVALLSRSGGPHRRRTTVLSSVALGAAALTRPEGILAFGLLELAPLTRLLRGRLAPRAWVGEGLPRWLPFALIAGAHLLWRHATYGDWVPNTFHAKVTPGADAWSEGGLYLARGALYISPILFLAPYALALLRQRPPREAAPEGFLGLLGVSTLYALYVVSVGGDYMPGFRFLLPLMPLWYALAAASLGSLARRRRATPSWVPVSLFLALGAASTAHEVLLAPRWEGMDIRHHRLVAAGRELDRILPRDALLAVTAAGRIPYFADRPSIDMLGLSDAHIASLPPRARRAELTGHVKGDGDYVLGREPDAIVFLRLTVTDHPLATNPNWLRVARRTAFGPSEEDITRNPRFQEGWRPLSARLEEEDTWLNFFARRGLYADGLPAGVIEATR